MRHHHHLPHPGEGKTIHQYVVHSLFPLNTWCRYTSSICINLASYPLYGHCSENRRKHFPMSLSLWVWWSDLHATDLFGFSYSSFPHPYSPPLPPIPPILAITWDKGADKCCTVAFSLSDHHPLSFSLLWPTVLGIFRPCLPIHPTTSHHLKRYQQEEQSARIFAPFPNLR